MEMAASVPPPGTGAARGIRMLLITALAMIRNLKERALENVSERLPVRTYYFDLKDGATVRDRTGLEFPTSQGAIEHSKELVRRLRGDPRVPNDPGLFISVIDESGAEIHQEKVYKGQAIPELKIQHYYG
jgi:hypothetical protein